MGVIKVTLTKDVLALVSNLRFQQFPDIADDKEVLNWGLDLNSLYGGSFLFEDIAGILGLQGTVLPDTLEDTDGAKYPEDVVARMLEAHTYLFDNLGNVEEILHQFSCRGGLQEGTYSCKSNEHIWKYKG